MAAKKLTKEQIEEVLERLKEQYPQAGCALDHKDPYQLLVAVTLSAQTTDVSVNKITPALFAKYPDAFAMAEANVSEVQEIIKTIGLYKTKSQRILDQARALVNLYDGQVPNDQDKLKGLPGGGQKTANGVMAEAFGHQRIAVDTHVFRVSNRIGLAKADNVEKTEEQLKKALPEERWTEAHHTIIFHGRQCCHARGPQCETCVLEGLCLRRGV